jgi:hypothetical protein
LTATSRTLPAETLSGITSSKQSSWKFYQFSLSQLKKALEGTLHLGFFIRGFFVKYLAKIGSFLNKSFVCRKNSVKDRKMSDTKNIFILIQDFPPLE